MAREKLSMEEVRVRLEQWRQTRQSKSPIPKELWVAAVELARREGVGRTAAALHLDGGKLKRLLAASGSEVSEAKPPVFVELLATTKPEYTIELEGRQGTLRIRCSGAAMADVAGLSRALWDATR